MLLTGSFPEGRLWGGQVKTQHGIGLATIVGLMALFNVFNGLIYGRE